VRRTPILYLEEAASAGPALAPAKKRRGLSIRKRPHVLRGAQRKPQAGGSKELE
jgi:hypothetical protein